MSSLAILPIPAPIRSGRKKSLSIMARKVRPKARTSDPYPVPSPTHKEDTETLEDENIDLPLGFSFWDDANRCFKPITTAERQTLFQVLCARYPQVEAITISIPFVIIECRDSVPPVDQQVFLAAGLVCVYIVEGGRLPFCSEYIGYYGEGDMPSDVPDHVSRDIRPFHIPKLSTFEYIHNMIPNATHVSSYSMQLVIELEATNPQVFEKKLMSLPSGIGKLSIGYINRKLLVRPP